MKPVKENACQALHLDLTLKLTKVLESVQKTVLHIIYPQMDYDLTLTEASIEMLNERRQHMCSKYVEKLNKTEHKISTSSKRLPVARDNAHNIRYSTCSEVQISEH